MPNVFAVPVFFICFRECLETSIIVSVLLSFIKQTLGPDQDKALYKKLVKQVWLGIIAGLTICFVIGGAFIGAFYGYGKNHFAQTEDLWEGVFSVLASLIIALMGAALLRVSKLQAKWRVKLAVALESRVRDLHKGTNTGGWFKRWCEKYAMFVLPFITVLREGLEAVIFIGGVGLGLPATSFPLAVVGGLAAGILVGWLIYRGGNMASLQIFLVVSTCFLYLVAAGLMSKGVWNFENHAYNQLTGGDAAETGSGPGSYDIRFSVWHVNCCNPLIGTNGGWTIFTALFGWTNSATLGSVISYNLFWVCVMAAFASMRYYEQKGHWPLLKPRAKDIPEGYSSSLDESNEKGNAKIHDMDLSRVREVGSSSSEHEAVTP